MVTFSFKKFVTLLNSHEIGKELDKLHVKYKLNEFQDEYFRRMQAPNPLFLKRMDEVMVNFIWNWDAFFKKYKMN